MIEAAGEKSGGAVSCGEVNFDPDPRGSEYLTPRRDSLAAAPFVASGSSLSISSRILSPAIKPSRTKICRGACTAMAGSCVTMTMVWPVMRLSRSNSARISAPVLESRLPVGSSASRICGSFTKARAMASAVWPPES